MKKLILSGLLLIGSLFVGIAEGQTRHDSHRWIWPRHERVRQLPRERDDRRYNDTYVVNEYRYVRQGRRVYKENYRSTYTRDGFLLNRVFVNREEVDNRRNNRFRFNVFLRF